jgi:hypothetical protein
MKMRILAAAAALAVAAAEPANSAVVHDYQLNGSLADAKGGADIVNRAGPGSLGATGITFGADLGPSITGYAETGVYSVEMVFSLDRVGSYNSILNFRNHDWNLYVKDARLEFFPIQNSGIDIFVVGQLAHVLVTRDASDVFKAYVNGVQHLSFVDSGDRAVIASTLQFFDDEAGENASGFVDYIRTYDRALSAEDAATLANGGTVDDAVGGIPEPGTWALMILGFGATGAALRSRRRLSAA